MKTLRERFEGKYEPVPEAGCWLWVGKLNDRGYGRLSRGRRGDGWHYAHRVSYELHVGPADGLDVLHRCDVPCCVNPSHLFLGTQGDNNRDRDAKGRQVAPRGQQNGMAKLTDETVRLILESQLSSLKLSPLIGINSSSIRKIRRGEAWRHVQ